MKIGLFIFSVLIQCSVFPLAPSFNFFSSERANKPQVFKASHEITKSTQPPCNEIDWAIWNSIADKSAAGTISSQGNSVNVTITSSFGFESAPKITRHEAFKRFKAPIPNEAVPRTSWSKTPGGVITICFSQTVKEPVLLLASLGNYKERIETTIRFSEPYVMLYEAGGMSVNNNTSLTGREGYALIKFPGDIKCITINSSTYESFTDLTWGIPVCPDGTPKPTPTGVILPEPSPKPLAILPKANQPITATVPEPAPKTTPIAPKPAETVAATKPRQAPEPAAAEPKQTLAIAKPASKPIVDIPKPEGTVAVVAPTPKPIASLSKPQKVKPELISKPVADGLEKLPVMAAVASTPVKKAPNLLQNSAQPKVVLLPDSTPKRVIAISGPTPKSPGASSKRVKPATTSDRESITGERATSKKPPFTNTDVLVKENTLRVEIWDYDGMDYDSVSLKFNGKQVGANSIQLQLYKRYGAPEFTYPLDLQPGDNTFEIYAISEGLKPSTTIGLLIMYDDKPKKLYFTLKAKETAVIRL